MNTPVNPRISKKEGTKKCSHSFRTKASKENGEHRRYKCQKLRNNSCRGKSQIQEKRKLREVSSSESSDNDQFSCQDYSEVDYLSLPPENEINRRTRELHGSFQNSSNKDIPLKDYTNALKDRLKEWSNN